MARSAGVVRPRPPDDGFADYQWVRHDKSGGRTPPGIDRQWSRLRVGKVDGLDSSRSGVQSNNYWSSTTYAPNPGNAWNVNLNDGNVNVNDKTNTNYVWPVRGGA